MSAETAERVDLPVTGMSCASCATTIEKQLSGTPGVVKASVNFATATATVDFDSRLAAQRLRENGFFITGGNNDSHRRPEVW